MKITGTVIRYGDNVDTDVIIPARYLNTSNPKELAAHCMEDLDATSSRRVKTGDIMVGGHNFGCGSSREHAPIAIKESGHRCVVAKSFAPHLLPAMPSTPALPSSNSMAISTRATSSKSISIRAGFRNLNQKYEGSFPPFPTFLQKIISKGGLFQAMEELA